jgi:putative hemolysin
MEQINIKSLIEEKSPGFFGKYPNFVSNMILAFLNKILHVKDINKFNEKNKDLKDFDFIDELFKYLNFKFHISKSDLLKIPQSGKLIIVSNHPLGGLDGLALLRAVSLVRKDVRIVVNDLLLNVTNISDLFLPYDLYSVKTQKSNIKKIEEDLDNNRCVMFFPAAVVSRLSSKGIQDKKWQKGAIRLAHKYKSSILPIYVDGRNSILFYLLAKINDRLGTFLLPHELFNKTDYTLNLKVGNIIPYQSFKNSKLHESKQNELLREHVYNLKDNKTEIFETEEPIIPPVEKELLTEELKKSELIGNTFDGKKIYISDYDNCKNIVREIARLREVTFRLVGEGTGKEMDFEKYDTYYRHMVLWDEDNKEIIGSYRIGKTRDIIAKLGREGLITSKKFDINDDFDDVLQQSLEVGRTFIQQKYWNSSALDYMWQGIGAFIIKNNDVRYLWGTVSMSDELPEKAKDLIVYYYLKWYKGNQELAVPHRKYKVDEEKTKEYEEVFNTLDCFKDFRILKKTLAQLGFSLPVLYRRYVDITNYGGTKFINFCIDVTFKNSVDGFIVVDLTQLKDEVRERYYNQKSFIK